MPPHRQRTSHLTADGAERQSSTVDARGQAWRASTRVAAATAKRGRSWVGGLLLALGSSPRQESAFHQGELGELAVAASLERRLAHGPAILLHDRRMPRGRGNIDHLAIAPSGVFVIDAKNIHGKVRVVQPLFGNQKLMVAGRDRSRLIDGLDRQVAAVRAALAADHPETPVQGVLCFTTADLPLVGTSRMRGHLLLYRRGLTKRLNASGPLGEGAIAAIAHVLADAFPPA
jgi:hypothetical protein